MTERFPKNLRLQYIIIKFPHNTVVKTRMKPTLGGMVSKCMGVKRKQCPRESVWGMFSVLVNM